MLAILHLLGTFFVNLCKSRRRREPVSSASSNIALRRAPWRLRLHGSGRALMVWMTRLWPSLLDTCQACLIPDTILVATSWVSGLLALEIPRSTGQAKNRTGTARTHPTR
jgi:hypothetical protein